MDIRDFYPICINLDHRVDRWEESKAELAKIFQNPIARYSAKKHSNPVIGCAESHFSVLKILERCDMHAMVFEDDVQILGNVNDLRACLSELDELKWSMFYMGANICGAITQVSDKLGRLSHAQSTHAYCVHKDFIKVILEHEGLIGTPMDLIYSSYIVPKYPCYISIPMLAIQRPSFSDIEKKNVNYNWMFERFNRNLVRKG